VNTQQLEQYFAFEYEHRSFDLSIIIQADCFEWMARIPKETVHAIVTDPPYGVKEYDFDQLEKRNNGNGGIWRIPPTFDGHQRAPLPRFTALSPTERKRLQEYFFEWARLVLHALYPGGHVFLASNSFLSQTVFTALADAGLEFRGEIIRLVKTLRGGDRPKNMEEQYPGVCTMPRGGYEPWGLFRKPLPKGMTVGDCLHTYGTGGLRRKVDGRPFEDVISSTRTPQEERDIADHPSLKPQSFLRQIVHAALPLGRGIVLDPFMGSGSTIAAAEAIGYLSIGVERHPDYFNMSQTAIPKLARMITKEAQLSLL
jgi:site-specific DNA-methyltransferase (adenine-specific)